MVIFPLICCDSGSLHWIKIEYGEIGVSEGAGINVGSTRDRERGNETRP